MNPITIDRALLEQALEALENAEDQLPKPYSTDASKAAVTLRAALAQEPQTTHSSECWRWHHKCAVAKIERECGQG